MKSTIMNDPKRDDVKSSHPWSWWRDEFPDWCWNAFGVLLIVGFVFGGLKLLSMALAP